MATALCLAGCVLLLAGCLGGNALLTPGVVTAPLENPLFVPAGDGEFVFNQVVDTLDSRFRIARQQRVRRVGDALIEGRVDTFPEVGSTYLEPWRDDSTAGFERLHATLQTVRRSAQTRIIPTEGGYLIDLTVVKELEDLNQPENSTVGSSVMRHDGSLVRPEDADAEGRITLGWIPFGRDASLEQELLQEIYGRVAGFQPPSRLPPAPE